MIDPLLDPDLVAAAVERLTEEETGELHALSERAATDEQRVAAVGRYLRRRFTEAEWEEIARERAAAWARFRAFATRGQR